MLRSLRAPGSHAVEKATSKSDVASHRRIFGRQQWDAFVEWVMIVVQV
jgi:hypothetical protein